jgi:hypothetical protein
VNRSIDEICHACEALLISAVIRDLELLDIGIREKADNENIVKLVESLIPTNSFANLGVAYRQWLEEMASAITSNLSEIAPGGSVSANYSMVPVGWEEMKCARQLGYELREHEQYMQHMLMLFDSSLQGALPPHAMRLINAHESALDNKDYLSPVDRFSQMIDDRLDSEKLEVNPERWFLDEDGDPLWRLPVQSRDHELIIIRDFLLELASSTGSPMTMVDCAVVINYLDFLPQSPPYCFSFEIIYQVNREYICAECNGTEFELELFINHNGNQQVCGRFDEEGFHADLHNAHFWLQQARELIQLGADITCDVALEDIDWRDGSAVDYWHRLEAVE